MNGLFLLSALASSVLAEVTLTPGDFEGNTDVSLTFGSHSTVSATEWHLGTDEKVAPDDWAIEVHMSGDLVFTERTDTVSVSADGVCIDSQCDMFWGFTDGHKFITFAHDFDGGLWVRNKQQKGLYIYPPCGGDMAEGDLVGMMPDSTTAKKGFWELRDDLGQGDRENFEEISTEHNEHTWPVTIEVTNDLVSGTTTFRFVSDTVDVECVYNDNFDSNHDLVATISPDVSKKDDLQIYSLTASKPVTVAGDCPMATTAIAGPNNAIAGCGFGCKTMDSAEECRDSCDAQSGCVSFSWNTDTSMCSLYDSATPTEQVDGNQVMCAVPGMPQCTIGCHGWNAFMSGDPHSQMWNGVYHHFQGRQDLDGTSPQQFYMMTPCDHNDRHYQPFSLLSKMKTWEGRSVTGTDYLTFELYDEHDTYYVFLSTGIRQYVHSGKAVSTLYDENVAAGVAMDTFYAGETIVANGKFKLTVNNNEGQDYMTFKLTHLPTGCSQSIYMQWQGTYNYQGSGRWQMHYVRYDLPECYKCTTCGWLGDFKHACYDPTVTGCDGSEIDMSNAKSWHPGSQGWDPTGWRWQKSYVDGDSCPDRAAGHIETMDTFCDENVQTEVIAKCQAARDAQATCCRNIGGSFCDELQDDCDIDVCIMASDDYSQLDALIESEFTDEVEAECQHQGLYGPVPKLLYEFRGDLSETMGGGADLESTGHAHVLEGALVCDGDDEYVLGSSDIDFAFTGHSMEVLVEIDNLQNFGGGVMSIDGKYSSDGGYGAVKYDAIAYTKGRDWMIGSESNDRTDTAGGFTRETAEGEMIHLVAVWDPDTDSVKLYRNGVEEQNYNPGDFLTASANDGWRVLFCKRRKPAPATFEGKIMFGAIYDYALTEQDVDQLFRAAVVEFDMDGAHWIVEAVGDELLPGQSLLRGQGLLSVDHRYVAALRRDGHFVIFDTEKDEVVFEAEMTAGEEATFGDDGNFVIYDTDGDEVWHSGVTNGNPHNLVMGTQGKLCAFDGNDAFWSSNEHEHVAVPTPMPTTAEPTPAPSDEPTSSPSADPSRSPTTEPTPSPSDEPTASPSADPSQSPTDEPTPSPSFFPTSDPTMRPTRSPVNSDECPMATTAIAGPNNDISGCGLGCSTRDSAADCRNACEAQSGCVSFSWTVDTALCTLYNTATPTQVADGEQIMCAVESAPQCTIGCQGWDAYMSGDPHSRMWNGVYHHFQGRMDMDANSPQQFYMMTPCDHNDRHHQPFSLLAKLKTWDGRTVTGADYLTFELYDEYDTYYVFLSTGIRKYVHSGNAVSTLYDQNVAAGVAMDTFYAGDTIVANGKFKLTVNNNEGQNYMAFTLTHLPTGCTQYIYMQWQHTWNYQGSGRWQMHYIHYGRPSCYQCTTCGWLGDFKHACYDPKVTGCDGSEIDMGNAKSWGPGSQGWDPTGWRWQKSYVDGENCPQGQGRGVQIDMDSFCDENVETEVIAKCQAARDAQATCCKNIGGDFCDELQDDCDIDVCIMASDDYSQLDALIESEFTDEVEAECDHQGLFGPVPKMLYEFRGDLTESMSDGASAYDLQSVGDAHVLDGALVCDGNGDYVYSAENMDFAFTGHSMEVLVEIDDLNSQGGGTIAIDGKYTSTGGYSHNKFDSIVYNEVSNNKKWILGSEYFSRTDTSGSDTTESKTGEMVHLVAVYDPDSDSAKLYRNGVEEMNYNPGGFLTASANDGWRVMFCQRHMNAGKEDFEGKIMFGAVYDYALTEQDVQQLFRAAVVDVDGSAVEAVGDELLAGQSLLRGQGLLSVDHRYVAALKTDGMFVIYDTENSAAVFEAEMTAGEEATFGDDGNFVIYGANGGAVWHSGSSHGNAHNLVMGVNGRLLAFGDDGVFWNSNRHQTVALSADQGMGVFEDLGSGWALKIGGQYSPLETYILYFCAALVVLNVFCGVLYCYNKRSRQQYKVVSLGSSNDDTSDVDTDLEDAKFLE